MTSFSPFLTRPLPVSLREGPWLLTFYGWPGPARSPTQTSHLTTPYTMSSSIQVVVRFRPLNKTERELGPERCVQVDAGGGPTEVLVLEPGKYGTAQDVKHPATSDKLFTFDGVVDTDGGQEDLFDLVGMPTVENVVKGYNGTILAYGQTGSGKTHSMVGPEGGTVDVLSPKSPNYGLRGVIPRIAEALFQRLEKFPPEEVTWKVTVSVFELYLEMVQDLLTDGPQQDYRIREDTINGKGIYIENLYAKKCQSASELLEAVRVGFGRRKVAATKSNETSSRSHSLTIVSVEQINHVKGNAVTTSRLNLVDLAGSEKVAKTQAAGDRLKEAQTINTSLSLLGSVIYKLTDGKSTHIPYRNSKLTRILQESFGGNSVTTLLCHCSPASFNKEETLSTLRFAARAKQIRNKPRVNRDLSPQELQMQYAQALDRIRSLEDKLAILAGSNANIGGSAISPARLRNSSHTPTRRTKDGSGEGAVDGGCGVEGHADMEDTINNLLAELDDVKKDFFEKAEELATAEGQVAFYREKAAKAEEEAAVGQSKLKREQALFQRRLLDLQAENEKLSQELSLLKNVAVTGGSASGLQLVDMADVGPKDSVGSRISGSTERTIGNEGAHVGAKKTRNLGGDRVQFGAGGLEAEVVSSVNTMTGPARPSMVIGDDAEYVSAPSVAVALEAGVDPSVRANGASTGTSRRVPSSIHSLATNRAGAGGEVAPVTTLEVLESVTPQGSRTNPRGVHGVPHIVESPARPLPVSTSEIGVTAQIGRSEAELLLAIEDLEQGLQNANAAKLAAERRDAEREAQLQRLGADLEKAHDDQDGLREELDSLRRILEATEKDNAFMRSILAKLNIDLEEYSALIGNEKMMNAHLKAEAEKLRSAADSLKATQEQQEYCEIASAELMVKAEDMDAVDNELGYMSYAALSSDRTHAAFQATRVSCQETLQQLRVFLSKLLDTLQGRTFNTSNLESQRLGIVSDSTALLSRVENAEQLLSDSNILSSGSPPVQQPVQRSPQPQSTAPAPAQSTQRPAPLSTHQLVDPRPSRHAQPSNEPQFDDPAPTRIVQRQPASRTTAPAPSAPSRSSVVDTRSYEPSLGGASRRSGSGVPRPGSFRR